MIAFENMVVNRTGTFPSTVAKNASGAGATDGTEYVAALVSNTWAWIQDLLVQAGMTPNGVSEAAATTAAAAATTAQQIRQAFEMKYGAPGELVYDLIVPGSGTYGSQAMSWGAAAGGPPSRYQYRRVLALSGQVITIASYPDLCAAIYCGDANNATAPANYKTSDAGGTTRSTSGAYMVLADHRGVTLRGRDVGASKDPAGATRLIASLQADALQGHYHSFYANGSGGSSTTVSSSTTNNATPGTFYTFGPSNDGTNGVPRTASETRMYNIQVNAGIRY